MPLWYNKVDMTIQWFYARLPIGRKAGSPYPFPSTNLFTCGAADLFPFAGCKGSHNYGFVQYLKMVKNKLRKRKRLI